MPAPAVIPGETGRRGAPADGGLGLPAAPAGLGLLGDALGANGIRLLNFGAMIVRNTAAVTVPSGESPPVGWTAYRSSVKLLMQMEWGCACSPPQLPPERQSLA